MFEIFSDQGNMTNISGNATQGNYLLKFLFFVVQLYNIPSHISKYTEIEYTYKIKLFLFVANSQDRTDPVLVF